MQPNGLGRGTGVMPQNWTVPHAPPLLARFLGKVVLDVLPAALASVIGGFLFTQYQFGHAVPRPVAEQPAPASAEMIQMVRDEHAMIIDYLKTQAAAAGAKAPDAEAAVAVVAKEVGEPAAPAPMSRIAVSAASKTAAARGKTPGGSAPVAVPVPAPAPQAPLMIAQADQNTATAPAGRLASDPDSILAKTLDIKDHVVAAAGHVVAVIGDMFASVGGFVGGTNPGSGSPGRQFSSAS